ncbi:MAG: hypothetical protein SFX73_23350 [Kofleriaceae bacterium]|nr:hypothetical protein [Kofleriaceae bacterium]
MRISGAALVVLLVCITAQAWGQSGTPAEQAFNRGRELLKVGNYAEACAAFEESQRLEPQTATQLNIALCSEQMGKLGTALRIHRDLAHREDNPQHKISADAVAALEPRAPRLKIDVSEGGQRARMPSGLTVRVNGMKATNFRETPGDLGLNRVVATAPGYKRVTSEVNITREGKTEVVTIILEPLEPGAPEELDPEDVQFNATTRKRKAAPPPTTSSSRKTIGISMTGLGAGVLVGGVVAGVMARSKWSDAKAACGGGTTCTSEEDLARGNELADSARSRGNISTVLVIAGGAVAAGGLVMWLTAPKQERGVALAPGAGSATAGLSLVGHF